MVQIDETQSQQQTITSNEQPVGETESSLDAATKWTVGQQLSPDFVIEGIVGHGGMGDVFLIRRLTDDRQFAVKTLLTHMIRRQRDRKQFLQELQTWIDLPEHPHMVTCRFFRTFGDRLAIFADLIDGGSLQEWIRDGRIESLASVFDIALQMAWGLDAAHRAGVIHQDVKPSNVLMTRNGVAKITDFGLARSPVRSTSSRADFSPPALPLVTSAGLTPAYCSPEQANGGRLSIQTDIWSWAVSVIEMLVGKITWRSGVVAPTVLDSLRKGDCRFQSLQSMRLIEVLEKALRMDLDERWSNFADIVAELKTAFHDTFHRPIERDDPLFTLRPGGTTPEEGRWRQTGVDWRSPDAVITQILIDAGRDPSEYSPPSRTSGSHTSQAMMDLTLFEDARDMVDRLISSGRREFLLCKADLLLDLAFIHEDLGDISGAIDLIEQKIAILEYLFGLHAQSKTLLNLASAYMNKANVISDANRLSESLPLYEHAIGLIGELFGTGADETKILEFRAKCLTNKARVHWQFAQYDLSRKLYLQAIDDWKRLFRLNKTVSISHCLAVTCMNLGVLLTDLTEHYDQAHRYLNLSMRYFRVFEGELDPKKLAFHFSQIYLGKSNAFFRQNKMNLAMKYINRAIAIRELLVLKEGRRNLAAGLATTYMNKASIYSSTDRYSSAIVYLDRSIELRSQLVFDENKTEIQLALVTVLLEKAILLEKMDCPQPAIDLYKKTRSLADRFNQLLPHKALLDARAYCVLALVVLEPENSPWSSEEIEDAIRRLELETIPTEIDRNRQLIARVRR